MNDAAKNQYRFDVFISYARTDSVPVERLVARLRNDGFSVWFDRDEMSGGHTTIGQLADGIACSAHMIACLSDSYVDRDYTDFELQTNQSFDPANRQNRQNGRPPGLGTSTRPPAGIEEVVFFLRHVGYTECSRSPPP